MRAPRGWIGGCLALLAIAAMLVWMAAPILARQPPRGGAPAAQDEFVPVKNLPQQEQLPGGPLVLAAYAFVWAALLVYVWTIWRRLGKVEREMRELAGRIKGHVGDGRA